VLGWPKNPPHGDAHTDAQSYHDVVVKYRSDWDIIKTAKSRKLFRFHNRDTMQWYFQYAKTPESLATITVRLRDITDAFNEINENFKIQLEQLKKTNAQKHVEVLNQLIADSEYINEQIVATIVANSDDNKQRFLTEYKITEADLPNFKFPGYNAPALRKSLNDALGPSTFLRHDNGERGRHIAPYNVDITSVIVINLVCDVIEGSYHVDVKQSNQAQQGYILYSFSTTAPPRYLIVESPINPVYMRCYNRF
jgi:hypothetical protein